MKKSAQKMRRDLEKKLLLKSETLRHLNLEIVTAGNNCIPLTSCENDTCVCTGTY